jgi:wyosine [tRNA(Phe)-imidazoG37] synthetase (radical SAM superfamily)
VALFSIARSVTANGPAGNAKVASGGGCGIVAAMKKILQAHREHPRTFDEFRFVYPVVSRRSGGLSIGVNVNPDRQCAFDCIYCQVDRRSAPSGARFDLGVAERELRAILEMTASGVLAKHPRFRDVPGELMELKDIALSGDGEPTTLPNFAETVAMVARLKPRAAKLLLITDAAGLDRADVKRGLATLDAHNGEIWAKLDAGTEEYFNLIDRSTIPFARILKNLTTCAKERAIVIQSLFLKVYGIGPSAEEIAAYCDRLREITGAGGTIKLVQISTVVREPMASINGAPAWRSVTGLGDAELEAIRAIVKQRTKLAVEVYGGTTARHGER